MKKAFYRILLTAAILPTVGSGCVNEEREHHDPVVQLAFEPVMHAQVRAGETPDNTESSTAERMFLFKRLSASAEIRPANVAVNTLDEKLMDGIMESIQKNMDNPDYSVEELSSDVNMHRMNLYRKLQSLVGMTPSEFIRTIRLKKAAQILSERPDISISELADMVGFNTPKYLTRYFKDMFGCTPSQYAGKL